MKTKMQCPPENILIASSGQIYIAKLPQTKKCPNNMLKHIYALSFERFKFPMFMNELYCEFGMIYD